MAPAAALVALAAALAAVSAPSSRVCGSRELLINGFPTGKDPIDKVGLRLDET